MKHRSTLLALVLTLPLAACAEADTQPTSVDGAAHVAHIKHDNNPAVNRWIAELRQATLAYREQENAAGGGWDTPVLPCMEEPGVGGMGQHYGDTGRMFDTDLDALKPELLVYEWQKNGRMKLVAVEWVVPYSAAPRAGPAPVLNGVTFHPNDGLEFWVLHAWIWKQNPAGMFENWNPTVSCAYAPAS